MGRCKDCTSRVDPAFQMTRRNQQKFRQFFGYVTGRFYPAKISLGQILERARANG
ncbi:hypothetical protein GCM10009103_31600 [Pseudomonas koreensis]|nr:hypothetical protein GCM10009103_31600 [Pseudomonas koreensis]